MDGIYARQSVDKKDSISIETQIELCFKEVEPGEAYKVYSDKGYSGSNLNRPAFQELIKDVKNGTIKRIIVYRLDRMSRSLLDFTNLINMLDMYEASFVSTQEKFDTATPMGRAMLNITMVFAQLERETIQRRITDNYYSRGEKGMYLGGPPPIGFDKAEKTVNNKKIKELVRNAKESDMVSAMFEWFIYEGLSLGKISNRLNRQKLFTKNNKNWSSGRVGMVLRNPIYVNADMDVYNYYKSKGCDITNSPEEFMGVKGCLLYGKRNANTRKYSTFDKHKLSLAPNEGFIASDLFLKCQRKLDSNTAINNKQWGTKSWLTGIMKCSECGRSLQAKDSISCKQGVKVTTSYWHCTGAIEHNGCECHKNLGKVSEVEGIVFEKIKYVVEQYKTVRVKTIQNVSRERESIRAKIEECEERINKLIELALSANDISNQYLNAKIAEADNEKREYIRKLEECESSLRVDMADNIEEVINRWESLNNSQRKEIAKLFMERIEVSYEEMKIYWRESFKA